MKRMIPAVLSCLICASAWAQARDDDDELRKDHAALEGTWQRTGRDQQGREIVITKTEKDGTSTLSVRDADGNVLHAHHSEYKLERSGQVRIFTYWNRTVTEGPEQGRIDTEPRSYLYRIHADRFFEIHGLMLGDEGPPSIVIWERVQQKEDMASLPSPAPVRGVDHVIGHSTESSDVGPAG